MKTLLPLFALFLAASCGDSKLTAGNISSSNSISGVAATGAPIVGGKVEIKGKNGVIVEDTTESDGSYSGDVSDLEEPYLVRVIAPTGEKYISVASQSALASGKKINVTPLTHTIVANVFGNADADELFTDFETEASNYTDEKLEEEKDELLQVFIAAGLVGAGGVVGADVDLLNGNLQAGTSIGVDGLLDVLTINTEDTGSGIQIKVKGSNTPIEVKLDGTANVVPNLAGEVANANAQLDVIALLRARMNALAALHSSKVSCNGAPVDDGSACGLDALYAAFLPYFHPSFQEDGNDRTVGIWDWFCRTEDDAVVKTKAQCLADGEIEFESVSLKDITLISYNSGTDEAVISFNFYVDNELRGSEEMTMKLDGGDSLYKLLGNKKTFRYWIETKSLHETTYDKSSAATTLNRYSVDLNFYMQDIGAYNFTGNETFTLTAASGHDIFPGDSDTMNLYLVRGPQYDNQGQCTDGFVLTTRADPYKVFNPTTGATTYATYAAACVENSGDPCQCSPAPGSWAYIDYEESMKVTLSLEQVARMEKIEKITLVNAGASIADEFIIRKPLVINEYNAAEYIPTFGATVANFCNNASFTAPLSLAVGAGYLNYVSLHHGFSDAGGTMWKNESSSLNLWDDNAKTATFTPDFSTDAAGDVIKYSNLFLSASDEFERRFERRVSCQE